VAKKRICGQVLVCSSFIRDGRKKGGENRRETQSGSGAVGAGSCDTVLVEGTVLLGRRIASNAAIFNYS